MALKLITAGESHGPGLTCIVEGLPAGLELDREAIDRDMARRQLGHGRGGRMKIERDRAEVTGGVRHGRTLGGPIALQVANRDFANWEERMNPWPVEAEVAEVHLPRPGHADLVGTWKYRLHRRAQRARARQRPRDRRPRGGRRAGQGLPARARRRGPLARGADRLGAGARARRSRCAWRTSRASTTTPCAAWTARRATRWSSTSTSSARRTSRSAASSRSSPSALTPGLGSHIELGGAASTARLTGALCSIQAVKGATIGDAFDVAGRPGSAAHDEIFFSDERGFYRETNHAGGLEGGMTTGEPVVVRAAMKPLPTLTKPLRSVDIATHEPADALRERTDSATIPAAGVVGEAMVAFVLAGAYREKFGGDHVDDVLEAVARYEERIAWRRR